MTPVDPAPDRRDRLFQLLPRVLQVSDIAGRGALQALLLIMAEQANIVEDDIAALLDNWFIETCDDWVTPYIADLVGYESVFEPSQFGPDQSIRDHERMRVLAPRAEAANTVRYRRRKGTLLVLQEIATAASGWPTRAVECRHNIAAAWNARFPSRVSGRTLNLHSSAELGRAGGPFDTSWKRTDLRRLASTQTRGLGSPLGILLWVWRLRIYEVRQGVASSHCCEDSYRKYTFDPFGLDCPLFTLAKPLPHPTQSAGELEVPAPIRRFTLRECPANYYGLDRSIYLWRGRPDWGVRVTSIIAADLSRWYCPLKTGQIAVDPELGRILCRWDDDERSALLKDKPPDAAVLFENDEPELWVRYHDAFSADIGGRSHRRVLTALPSSGAKWTVCRNRPADASQNIFNQLSDALDRWAELTRPRRVVIEIQDDETYGLGLRDRHKRRTVPLDEDDYLEIRASQGRRPALLPGEPGCGYEWRFGHKRDVRKPERGGSLVLDGLRMADMTVVFTESVAQACIRDTTLIPGRTELRLQSFLGKVSVDRCILGTVETQHHYDGSLAPCLSISDSILDGAGKPALCANEHHRAAYVRLWIARATLFGAVRVYELDFAADSIFFDDLETVLWQRGLMRYCSISAQTALSMPSPTPPRYACQPDRAISGLAGPAKELEARRIVPVFSSRRYGDPTYARLSGLCVREIADGAEDESEMGVYHDLYQPQREALLQARLEEYTLAQANARLKFAT